MLHLRSKLPVSMDQSIKCQSVSPAGGEVLDLNAIIPEIKCTRWLHYVHCTIQHHYLDTFIQTPNSDNSVTTLFGHLGLKRLSSAIKCNINPLCPKFKINHDKHNCPNAKIVPWEYHISSRNFLRWYFHCLVSSTHEILVIIRWLIFSRERAWKKCRPVAQNK